MIQTATPSKIIVDTDPGIDDAYAILYALRHPGLDVLALTAVHGNVPVDLAAANALRLVELSGSKVPVAMGCAVPRVVAPMAYPDFIHGADGFGNLNLALPSGQLLDEHAAQTIVRLVRQYPGEVTLIPVGPLTNIALALDLAPDIVDLVAGVIVMGGAAQVPGNITPAAEANIYHDPHAAERVVAARWPVSMVGLDVTHQVFLEADQIAALAIADPDLGALLARMSAFYQAFYLEHCGLNGIVPHDLVAVMGLTAPDLFETQSGRVQVALEGPARGNTVFWPDGRALPGPEAADLPVQTVVTSVDGRALLDRFFKDFAGSKTSQ